MAPHLHFCGEQSKEERWFSWFHGGVLVHSTFMHSKRQPLRFEKGHRGVCVCVGGGVMHRVESAVA